MEFKFELLEQDYIDFNLFYNMNTPNIKRNILPIKYLVPLVLVLIFLNAWATLEKVTWIHLALGIIVCVVWFLRFPKIWEKMIISTVKKRLAEGTAGADFGMTKLVISDKEVSAISSNQEIKASKIERIEETEKYIFAFFSPVMAFIIPKRVFVNMNDRNKVFDLLCSIKNQN